MPQTIVAVLEQIETAASVLATAGLLQRHMAIGLIEILHISHDPREGFMPTEEVMTPRHWQALAQQAAARIEALKSAVDVWQGSENRSVWHERTGDSATILRTNCAMADYIVVGRPVGGLSRKNLNTLLFGIPTAIILAPRDPPVTLGQHIGIGWKESPAADNALKLSLPILQRARQVTLLMGDEGASGMHEEPAWFLQAMVAASVPIGVQRFVVGSRNIGQALLEEAQAVGGDMLVMGAYTHSRLREAMLGGATRDILAAAGLPVLLTHQ